MSVDQRLYASSYGRFNSPDPYKPSGATGDPGSWNRHSYTGGDPINYNDPGGLARCSVVGTSTTNSDAENALNPVSTANIWCTSTFGIVSQYQSSVPFNGDRNQAAKDAESSVGADLDQDEQLRLSLLLRQAYGAALVDLGNPDCAGLFGAKDGSGFLKDPRTGQDLSPERVLTNIIAGDHGYGSVGFGLLNDGVAGTTSGVGLRIGLQGPYYQRVC